MSALRLAERLDEEHAADAAGLLRSSEVCRLAGVTYRQLDYMIRTGQVQAALPAEGSGTVRYFDPEVVTQLVAHNAAVDECPRCRRRSHR